MVGQTYGFNIGDFECWVICDREEHLAATWLLAATPPDELAQGLREQGYQDTLDFSMNLLVIRTPDEMILVDAGLPITQTLPQSLKDNGIDPADISRVIISHGDDDHIGGLAYQDGLLTYPNARYSICKTEWDYYLGEAQKPENPNLVARRGLFAIKHHVDWVEREAEITPGVQALFTPGHKLGHMSVLIESRGEHLLHLVDAIHHPIQVVHPDWTPAFEMQRDVSAQTRIRWVQRAADENLLTMAYHFPFPGLGHIVRENATYRWQPIQI